MLSNFISHVFIRLGTNNMLEIGDVILKAKEVCCFLCKLMSLGSKFTENGVNDRENASTALRRYEESFSCRQALILLLMYKNNGLHADC